MSWWVCIGRDIEGNLERRNMWSSNGVAACCFGGDGLQPTSRKSITPIHMAITMRFARPLSYQLFLWLFLWLFLLGFRGLKVTNYSYGYSHGVPVTSRLPTIPMAIPTGIPRPLTYQLMLNVLLEIVVWGRCQYNGSVRISIKIL